MAYVNPYMPSNNGIGYNPTSYTGVYPSYTTQRPDLQTPSPYNGGMVGNNIGVQPTATMPNNNGIPGMSSASRIVTSKEECTAIPSDFSGAPMVFPDITHNKIYLKRWDFATGSSVFVEYVPAQTQQAQAQQSDVSTQEQVSYATVDSLNSVQDYIVKLEKNMENLENEIARLKRSGPVQQGKPFSRKKDNVRGDDDE